MEFPYPENLDVDVREPAVNALTEAAKELGMEVVIRGSREYRRR